MRILIVQRGLTHYRKLLLQYIADQNEYEIDILQIGNENKKEGNVYTFLARDLFKYKNYRLKRSRGMIDYIKNNYDNYERIVLEGATNLINNLSICRFLRRKNKPYIIWDAGRRKNSSMSILRKMAQKQLEFVWKNASAIIAYSTLAKQYFGSIGIQEEKIFVCQNTLYVGEFDKQISKISKEKLNEIKREYATNGEKIILYVGAIEKRKRIIDLVEAFKIVHEKDSKTVLLIIGGGEQLEEIKSIVMREEEIYCLGSIVDGVIKFFMSADLFVLPSEGGLSLNQAMICGKPLIASSADGTELDLIEDGKNGYIFEEGNIQELAEKIMSILSNEEKRTEMGIYSRKIIDNRVNEKMFYHNFKECLNYINYNGERKNG